MIRQELTSAGTSMSGRNEQVGCKEAIEDRRRGRFKCPDG